MNASIHNPANSEVRSVIRVLHAKGERTEDIRKEIVSVYGNIMNRQNVTKWCCAFSGGRTSIHADPRTGRPPVHPGLAPSDYHLFLYLKKHLAGQNLLDDDKIKMEVEMRGLE